MSLLLVPTTWQTTLTPSNCNQHCHWLMGGGHCQNGRSVQGTTIGDYNVDDDENG